MCKRSWGFGLVERLANDRAIRQLILMFDNSVLIKNCYKMLKILIIRGEFIESAAYEEILNFLSVESAFDESFKYSPSASTLSVSINQLSVG